MNYIDRIIDNNSELNELLSEVENMDSVDWKVSDEEIRAELSGVEQMTSNLRTQIRQDLSNALKGTVSGSTIAIEDVSPVEHEMSVKVSIKNLIPYPFKETTKTFNGVTFTDNEDGTITVNGTATADAYFILVQQGAFLPLNTTMTVSGCPAGGSATTYYMYSNGFFEAYEMGQTYTFTLSKSDSQNSILIMIKSGYTANNLVFKPQVEFGATATPFAPYDDSVLWANLWRYSKNMFWVPETSHTSSGGGSFSANRSHFDIHLPLGSTSLEYLAADGSKSNWQTILPPGSYTLRGRNFTTNDTTGGSWGSCLLTVHQESDDALLATCHIKYANTSATFTLDEWTVVYFSLQSHMGATPYEIKTSIDMLLIRDGDFSSTNWTESTEPIYVSPDENGVVSGITSRYPNTFLISEAAEGTARIECEYNKDVNVVYNELVNAIVSLGGDI